VDGVRTEIPTKLDVMSQNSFDDFYLREFRPMVALAAAVSGSSLLAEDLAQEAMTRVYRRWDSISGYDKPGAFARRVTINLAASRRKRDAVAERGRSRLGTQHAVPPPAEPHTEIWEAINRLPGNQRAAIALHYLEDRPVDEIADILGCASATARVHLHRARSTLAKLLEGHER
jgi:RNA polymerase sigma-70 factor (ECF subfamily)